MIANIISDSPLSFPRQQPISSNMATVTPISSSSTIPSTPIDSRALDEIRALQQEGKPNLLAQVVEKYLSLSPRLLQSLQDAVAGQDALALQKAAHSWKSSSASLGAATLAALCQELETMGRQQHLENAAAVLQHTAAEYETVRAALTAEIQQESP